MKRIPRVGDKGMILPSDGTFSYTPATVRRVYKTNALSVMINPADLSENEGAGMLIHPKTGMIHYIVSLEDFDLFQRGD